MRWTIYNCSECNWKQLGDPGGLPCINCLRYETFRPVEMVPASYTDEDAERVAKVLRATFNAEGSEAAARAALDAYLKAQT